MTSVYARIFTPGMNESTPEVKDGGDVVAEYFTTTEGAKSLFGILEHTVKWLKSLDKMRHSNMASTATTVAASAGSVLSIPLFIEGINTLRKRWTQFAQAVSAPELAPDRTTRIGRAAVCLGTQACNVANMGFEAALFGADAGLIKGLNIPMATAGYNITQVACDVIDTCEQHCQITENRDQLSKTIRPSFKEEINGQINLSWLKIVKNVVSIAGAALALVALAFGIGGVVAPIALSLSSAWLIFKVSTYFYEKSLNNLRALG